MQATLEMSARQAAAMKHLAQDGTFALDASRHLVVELPLTGWLTREFPHDRLFTYKHLVTGRFMVGRWLSESKSRFVPVMEIGETVSGFDRDRAMELRGRVAEVGRTTDALQKAILSEANDAANTAADEQREYEDIHKHMRRNIHSAVRKDHPLLRAAAGIDK